MFGWPLYLAYLEVPGVGEVVGDGHPVVVGDNQVVQAEDRVGVALHPPDLGHKGKN